MGSWRSCGGAAGNSIADAVRFTVARDRMRFTRTWGRRISLFCMRSVWQRIGLGGGVGGVLGAGSGATFAAAAYGGRSAGAAAAGTGRRQTGYGKKRG